MDKDFYVLMWHDLGLNASGVVAIYDSELECKGQLDALSMFKRKEVQFSMSGHDLGSLGEFNR